jgi:hypothetical protein
MEALEPRLCSARETIRILSQPIDGRESKRLSKNQLGALGSIYRKRRDCQPCRLITHVINDHLATAYIERMCQDDEDEEYTCDLAWKPIGRTESSSPQK